MRDITPNKEQESTEKTPESAKGETRSSSVTKESLSKNEESGKATPEKSRGKKGKRQVSRGQAHIQCTYNNTMVMLSDAQGGTLAWSSSGLLGFKGAKKSTPYAATQVVADVTEKVRKFQMKEIEVFVKGVGSGREASIRALANNGFELTSIKDITPLAHNGCRPRRPRRV